MCCKDWIVHWSSIPHRAFNHSDYAQIGILRLQFWSRDERRVVQGWRNMIRPDSVSSSLSLNEQFAEVNSNLQGAIAISYIRLHQTCSECSIFEAALDQLRVAVVCHQDFFARVWGSRHMPIFCVDD